MTRYKQNWIRERLGWFGCRVRMVRGVAVALPAVGLATALALAPPTALAADAAIGRSTRPGVGDCDNSGTVTINEVVTGLRIALHRVPLDACPAFDCDGTGAVTVHCIIEALDAALNACDPGPTPSPTRTRTPSPTSTVTPTATR